MNAKLHIVLSITLPACLLSAYVLAQQLAPTGPGRSRTVRDAIALHDQGHYPDALDLLASVPEADPERQTADCYRALCLYHLQDRQAFWKTVEALDLKAVQVAPALREDLAAKQLEVLLHFRKFEDLIPRIQSFQTNYPASTRLQAVCEWHMAALFERGMKKTQEASILKDSAKSARRWAEGKANLEEFVSLASAFNATNYTTLPKRDLAKDIFVALLTLGEENTILAQVPVNDAATLEQVKFLRLQLHQKLQPGSIDRNLQLMSDFLEQFPQSPNRKRIEFDMASRSYERGLELCFEADNAEAQGDGTSARDRRAAAGTYFALQRSLQMHKAEATQGIEASDILDMRKDLLISYWLEKQYDTLASQSAALLAESTPWDLSWIVGKVFSGIALMGPTPPSARRAAQIFDEVLALGFKNKPDQDVFVEVAARWRVHIALQAGDKTKAREVVEWVQDGNCTKDIQAVFLTDHAGLTHP
jgi:hypothetical protein